MLSKDRCKTTSGIFVIPLLSQLWEKKNYCERRNEFSSWRPVVLPNRHIHLCLFKLGYDVHALLSSVMYILSGENITAVYTISRRRWDQNTSQVAHRLDWARATYVGLLHLTPWATPPPPKQSEEVKIFLVKLLGQCLPIIVNIRPQLRNLEFGHFLGRWFPRPQVILLGHFWVQRPWIQPSGSSGQISTVSSVC